MSKKCSVFMLVFALLLSSMPGMPVLAAYNGDVVK